MSTAIGMTGVGTTVPCSNHGGAASTRLHLTRRGRVVFTTLAAVPVAAVALALALNGGIAAAEGSSTGSGGVGSSQDQGIATVFDYVTIQSGQSLWQLAESIAPTSDPRDVIAEIVSLNQLPSENVQPGQRLALPTTY